MKKMGAVLEELFEVFASQLLAEVKAAVKDKLPIPAADKASIIRFLQINNMVYTPADSDVLLALREQLMAKQVASSGSALAALRSAESDLADVHRLYGADKLQ